MGLDIQKIVLITSGQPSLNPRLVKEADTLVEEGYEVSVIYQYWNEWGTDLDQKLLPQKKWKTIRVGGDPIEEKTTYWWSRIKLKIGQKLVKLLGFRYNLAELALGRCTLQLLSEAKRNPADLYIAHNLSALPAAVMAAQKFNTQCGFDAEDFHRNEVSDHPDSLEVRLKTYIEDKYITKLNYLTTASPLISKAYKELYPNQNPITLLNVFPSKKIVNKANEFGPLNLFWFSQTIGSDRGLEEVIEAMGSLKEFNITLHLLGNLNASAQTYFDELADANRLNKKSIFYYKPIPSDDVLTFVSKFDIGLATEIGIPKNRDICLTNKIFTYIQAGLAIVASNTQAQKELMHAYPNMGMVYEKKNAADLAAIIKAYIGDQTLLKQHQFQASQYANEGLNWEREKEKFLTIIHHSLTNPSN